MNTYEQKQEARKERLEAAADRAAEKANALFRKGDMREEFSGIPMGQPILVGHHSEGKHRRALEKADNAMRAGVEASKRAEMLRERAAGVGSGGISSDDPDAIDKLQAKIDAAQAKQDAMKAENAAWRKQGNKAGRQKDGTWLDGPFASFELQNNNANIKRMKDRLAHIERERNAKPVEQDGDGFRYVECPDANRVQFFFDGKPDAETRAILKGRGFRWAPSQGAWQRHLNNAGRFAASCVKKELANLA